MKDLKLNASRRDKSEKMSKIKAESMLAGVVYGHSQEPISLKMDYSEFLKLFRKSGESHVVKLTIGKESMDVLVHEVQKEPVSGNFKHIDFYAITAGEKVTTHIHLNFINVSPAVATEGAIVEEHMKEIEVKCLPKDLIDGFDVDLSLLKETGSSIRVSELNIDLEKYQVMANPEDSVVAASAPAKIEIEEPVEVAAEGEDGAAESEEKKEG